MRWLARSATAACWTSFGLAGVALAVWRLRPSCLSVGVTLAKTGKRRKAPPVRERPMLWKELYIERVASLGRFGRWLGVSAHARHRRRQPRPGGDDGLFGYFSARFRSWRRWASSILSVVLGGFAGTLLGWLLQWGVGLRAAVSIASERERGTWDALLMSPLDPSEIGRGQAHRQPLCTALAWQPPCCWPGPWRLLVGAVSVAVVCHLGRRKPDDGRVHGRRRRAVFAFAADGHQGDELDNRPLAGRMARRGVRRHLDDRRGFPGLHQLSGRLRCPTG